MSLISKFGHLDVYLGADHSQLEIRVLAQMSKDPLLLELIQSGKDIHAMVGAELTGQSFEKIKKNREIRTAIKGLHFGIIYGLGETGLYYHIKNQAAERHESFSMTPEQVAKLHRGYFKKFSVVKEFIDEMCALAEKNACVKTLFGFEREIALNGDDTRTTFWRNQAVNSPIQGTAHQLMLIVMAILRLRLRTYNLLQRTSMEVHDSLYVFVRLFDLLEAYKQFMQVMQEEALVYVRKWWPEVKWIVPLAAEAKAGFRLGVMCEYTGQPAEEFLEQWCEKNHEFEKKMLAEMTADLQ